MVAANKKAPSVAALRAQESRRPVSRQTTTIILSHFIRFCILFLGVAALAGLGALIEEGAVSGLILAGLCAWAMRRLLGLLPEGRRWG